MYNKPYLPILLIVCNIISMKNVIKFIKSVKSLNVKLLNVNVKLSVLWFLLIELYYLPLKEMVDWNWHPVVSSPSNQETLVLINQSSYFICFCYNLCDTAKETNMYEMKLKRLCSQILTCFIFLDLFSKNITKKQHFRK